MTDVDIPEDWTPSEAASTTAPGRHPARWWHALDDGRLQCDLCPRACRVRDGQRGFCFVRQALGGGMELTTYGRSTGFCIDPIEKKPLAHFLPGTAVLSFGTGGCNLGCRFCQNWSASKSREIEIMSEVATPHDIAAAAVRHGCRSVAFTYNDPVIWAEYAIDTAAACRAVGVKTVAVTAGYITAEARPQFYAGIDAANVDLKAFSEHFYQKLTFSHLAPVLETLRWIKHESQTWLEVTTLLIPRENDSADEVARMCDWIAENLGPDVPLHFTAFHPDYKMRTHGPTPVETLMRARAQAMERGLRYVYTGNVHDAASQSTWCPGCGALVIERDWHALGRWGLRGGACAACGAPIAGVFDDKPGTWGARRQPIRIDGGNH